MSITLSTPRGFHPTCELLNIISVDEQLFATFYEVAQLKTKDMAFQQTLLQLTQQSAAVSAQLAEENSSQSAATSTTTFTPVNIQSMVDALTHIVMSLQKHVEKLSAAQYSAVLQQHTILTPKSIALLTNMVYNKKTDAENLTTTNAFTIGRIVDTQFKIGLSISSSSCEKLYDPFITLSMTIDKPHQGQQLQSYELSISDYHRLQNTLTEIKQAMDDML